jgi:precorrin-3B synthase
MIRSDRAPHRFRPDRCPGVLALHEASDGWLARVRLPGGRLRSSQLRALADLAGMGSETVQLTARANLQVRGLEAGASEELAAGLEAAGLLPSRTHERVRNVLASPLAGRHPAARADVDGLVAGLDCELCADTDMARLPRRFLFLVEDGSGVLGEAEHDVALVPTPGGQDELALLLDGLDSGWRVPAVDAPALALAAARLFLALRGDEWRVRELAGGAPALIDALRDARLPVSARRGEATAVLAQASPTKLAAGRVRQRDGHLALTARVPLGCLRSAQLRALADLGAELRVSPWRTVSLVDLPDDLCAGELVSIGLELDPAAPQGVDALYAGEPTR